MLAGITVCPASRRRGTRPGQEETSRKRQENPMERASMEDPGQPRVHAGLGLGWPPPGSSRCPSLCCSASGVSSPLPAASILPLARRPMRVRVLHFPEMPESSAPPFQSISLTSETRTGTRRFRMAARLDGAWQQHGRARYHLARPQVGEEHALPFC